MTAPRLSASDLPGWPRLLPRDQAAAYSGLSPNAFDAEVAAGTFPGPYPLQVTRRSLWDRKALDAAMDRAAGLATGANDDWGAREKAWKARRQGREAAPR